MRIIALLALSITCLLAADQPAESLSGSLTLTNPDKDNRFSTFSTTGLLASSVIARSYALVAQGGDGGPVWVKPDGNAFADAACTIPVEPAEALRRIASAICKSQGFNP